MMSSEKERYLRGQILLNANWSQKIRRLQRTAHSGYSCQCNTGAETKPCCSSPCRYSDQKLIECSPPYSRITVNGKKCLDDYPCATHGYDYYWCKTANSWDYCSPPLRNSKTINGQYCRINYACAKYKWCYTDDEDTVGSRWFTVLITIDTKV